MADKVWKAMERRVAAKLGGKRIPCSGSGQISGDVLHDTFEIECKYRRKFALKGWFERLKEVAAKSGKIPLLVVKMKGQHSEFAVLDLKTLAGILEDGIRRAEAGYDMVCAGDERVKMKERRFWATAKTARKKSKEVDIYECTTTNRQKTCRCEQIG